MSKPQKPPNEENHRKGEHPSISIQLTPSTTTQASTTSKIPSHIYHKEKFVENVTSSKNAEMSISEPTTIDKKKSRRTNPSTPKTNQFKPPRTSEKKSNPTITLVPPPPPISKLITGSVPRNRLPSSSSAKSRITVTSAGSDYSAMTIATTNTEDSLSMSTRGTSFTFPDNQSEDMKQEESETQKNQQNLLLEPQRRSKASKRSIRSRNKSKNSVKKDEDTAKIPNADTESTEVSVPVQLGIISRKRKPKKMLKPSTQPVQPQPNLVIPDLTFTIGKEKRKKSRKISSKSPRISKSKKSTPFIKNDAPMIQEQKNNEVYQIQPVKDQHHKHHKLDKLLQSDRNFRRAIFQRRPTVNHSSDSSEWTSESDDSDSNPDMSWILRNDNDTRSQKLGDEPSESYMGDDDTYRDFDESKGAIENKKLYDSIRPLLLSLLSFGRMPLFIFHEEKTGLLKCEVHHRKPRFIVFVITTILMLIALISLSMSAYVIIFIPSNNTDKELDYVRFEKLLLQKHWLHMVVLLMSLVYAVVCSFSMIVHGQDMADHINDWGQSIYDLKYDASNGISFMVYFHLSSTILNGIFWAAFVHTNTLGFYESHRFISILLFRWVIPDAYHSSVISNLQSPLLFFQWYVFFASRSIIGLVFLFCRALVNIAHHWNLRISLILRKIIPNEGRKDLVELLHRLRYETMLRDHFIIVKLVRRISSSFALIFQMFFIQMIIVVIAEMLRIATSYVINVRVKNVADNETVGNTTVFYNIKPAENAFEICYFIFTTVGIFATISLGIAAVGQTVMNGFDAVRRHGLILAKGVKERKFIMSLNMSFNGKNPYIIQPGKLFGIDKSIIFSILAMVSLVFSIIIQYKVINLVEVSIVVPCRDDVTGEIKLCIENVVIDQNIKEVNESIQDKINQTTLIINPPTTTTIITTTTIPFNPCPEKDAKFEKDDFYKKKCTFTCKYKKSRVKRIIPRDKYGKTRFPELNHEGIKCITNPYEKLSDSEPIYDCFGNCYIGKDKCGNFAFNAFTLKDGVPPQSPYSEKGVVSIEGTDYRGSCFKDDKDNSHPLEECSMPYPILESVCNGKSSEVNGFDTYNLFPSLPSNFKTICEKLSTNTDPMKNAHTAISMTVTLLGQTFTLWRLIPYTYIRGEPGLAIPLNMDSSEGFAAHPYDYIHPRLTKSKNSFGYFDCFGNPLQDFDECGGLEFYILKKDCPTEVNCSPDIESPGKERVGGSRALGKTYECYKSWLPGYRCGVPTSVSNAPEIIDELCEKWKDYLD